jgi:CRISPR-associated protein Csc3
VEEILNGICDGRPGRLKKLANNLADGYYSATLNIRRRYWKNKNAEDLKNMEESV